jgi:tetratricopeptide (TPR) repeat protein
MDPLSLAVASAIATKGTELAMEHAPRVWQELVKLVRGRVAGDTTAATTLALAQDAPDEQPRVDQLAAVIDRLRSLDSEFDRQLRTTFIDFVSVQQASGEVLTATKIRLQQAAPVSLGRTTPQQLPTVSHNFAGRDDELFTLGDFLEDAEKLAGPAIVTVIHGTAGVGKTTLATYWAHQIKRHFPDGQLYINLRGFGPIDTPVAPAEAIRGFLDAFDVPSERIPQGLDAQATLYRSLLADRRVLLFLDNARDVEQVRPLLPGSASCFVMVTSRNQLGGLVAADGARPMSLSLLSGGEASELLARYVSQQRVDAEPDAVRRLIDRCGRLPLALAIVAARAAMSPHLPLQALADELRNEPDVFDALDIGDPTTDVRAVFSWSYRALTPQTARTFRLLGLHPGPDIIVEAAASLTGNPVGTVRGHLTELTRASLLEEHLPSRFRLHDLLHEYAAKRAADEDSREQRHEAMLRLLDYYLHTGYSGDKCLYPHRDAPVLGIPQAGAIPRVLADRAEAAKWFTAELPTLLALEDYAAGNRFDTYAWQLPWVLATYLHRRGQWQVYLALQKAALAAADRIGDPTILARVHRNIGRPFTLLDRSADAIAHYEKALSLTRELADPIGQGLSHDALTWTYGRMEQHDNAITHARQALELYTAAGNQAGQARALNYIGWNNGRLGRYQETLTFSHQALELFRAIDNRVGEADTVDSLGYAHQHLQHYAEAIASYEQSVALWRDLGDRYNEADVLSRLGDVRLATGDRDGARHEWEQALEILEDIKHPDAVLVGAKLTALRSP